MKAMSQIVDSLQSAREAAERHAWRESYDAYAGVDATDLTPDDLERFADAAWWTGKLDEAIALRERSYAGFAAAGDKPRAARLALTLSWDHCGRGASRSRRAGLRMPSGCSTGSPSPPSTAFWRSRGRQRAVRRRRLPEAIANFDRAFEIAGAWRPRHEALAIVGKGRALVKSGEIEPGLALLDEATASAFCGELRPYSTGLVYCITISSCQDLGDYRRAAEWTEEANRWCDRLDVTGFPGACRIHRAEIMRLRGDWPAAEAQAVAACEELHDFERTSPQAATTRSARSVAGAATSRQPRRRTRRRTSWGATRSPGSPSCAWPRARSTRLSRGSAARSEMSRIPWRACGASLRRSRSRSPPPT